MPEGRRRLLVRGGRRGYDDEGIEDPEQPVVVITTRSSRLSDRPEAPRPREFHAELAVRQNTLEFSLAGGLADLGMTNHTIALGWLLANGSTHDMEAALCTPRHAAAVRQVQAALGAQTGWACEAGSEAKGKGTEGVRAVKR